MGSPRRSKQRLVLNRFVLRASRRLSAEAKAAILLATGIVTGLGIAFGYGLLRGAPVCATPTASRSSAASIVAGDKCADKEASCYVFAFATGRSGTQHLSRVLLSRPRPSEQTYITHEEEHLSTRTKFIVEHDYRQMATAPNEDEFNRMAKEYVIRSKIPFYDALKLQHGAKRLLYTGHVPMVFGLGPALIDSLPARSVRILRMRRDRIATALSLMALGPEAEDPWGSTEERDVRGRLLKAPSVNRRWFPRPTNAMVRLQVSSSAWTNFNRFQRWLWYVDDVECRWQALRHEFEGKFSWLEVDLESLNVLDGGAGWERVADFVGVGVNWEKVGKRDNSIQHKMRTKSNASEATLREWDTQYQHQVGACRINDKVRFRWGEHAVYDSRHDDFVRTLE